MKILLIHREHEAREILSFALGSKLNAQVSGVSSAEKGVNFLLDGSAFDLIVMDLQKIEDNPLLEFLQSCGAQIPIVGLGKKEFPEINKSQFPSFLGYINLEKTSEELIPFIQKWIEEGSIYLGQSDDNFCQIKIDLFLRLSPLMTDVYIKLSQTNFVKLYGRGHHFTADDFDRVRFGKKQEYLYVKKDSCDEIIRLLLDDLSRLIQSQETPGSVLHNMTLSSHETMLELSSKLGLTPEVQDLTRAAVTLTTRAIGKNPQLSQILKRMDEMGSRYLSAHSLLTAHVSCSIASLMGWPEESTFLKLTFASILHDVSLGGTQFGPMNLSEHFIEKNPALLSAEELAVFKKHPLQSANMVRSFEKLPADVITIIEQHHELPYGTGFPSGLTGQQITPISTAFIVAHDLIDYVLEKGVEDFYLKDFLNDFTAKYSTAYFKEIYTVLKTKAE